MLEIHIPDVEGWDQEKGENGEFVTKKGADLILEHSLVSLQKWEAKWKKPYLLDNNKTDEEMLDYIRCMTMTKNVDPDLYYYIPASEMQKIADYINDPMTATTINDKRPGRSKEIVTAELVYFWMINYGIPMEYRKWHFNQLLTLIKVCEIKNSSGEKGSKMSMNEIYASNRELNAKRRAMAHSKG